MSCRHVWRFFFAFAVLTFAAALDALRSDVLGNDECNRLWVLKNSSFA